ncbi:MAG: hypothetical protein NUV88_03685, partial [Candidatus Kaiserbacteria bacterium]|nr:hypothetical protein [Candidatus Kaiserbacteria bacterium]
GGIVFCMVEKTRNNPREKFRKSDLVMLKENVSSAVLEALADQFQPGVSYKVVYTGRQVAWIGPNDMPPQDVEDFRPQLAFEQRQKRYEAVFPVATEHLRKVPAN